MNVSFVFFGIVTKIQIFFSPLISIIQLYDQLHYKYLQNL